MSDAPERSSGRRSRPTGYRHSSTAGGLSVDEQTQLAELLAQFPDAPARSPPRVEDRGPKLTIPVAPVAAAGAAGIVSPQRTDQAYSTVFGTLDEPLRQTNQHYIDLITR